MPPDMQRCWYTRDVAVEVAREIAAEERRRQRVERCDPAGNPWGCGWRIVPTDAPAVRCRCWPVDNPWTYYGIVEPGGALEPNPDCRAHFPERQGGEPCS